MRPSQRTGGEKDDTTRRGKGGVPPPGKLPLLITRSNSLCLAVGKGEITRRIKKGVKKILARGKKPILRQKKAPLLVAETPDASQGREFKARGAAKTLSLQGGDLREECRRAIKMEGKG